MKTVFFGALAIVSIPFIAVAQQSGGVAYSDDWNGGAPLPPVNQAYQPQPDVANQTKYRTSDYFAINQARPQEQPHYHTYEVTQVTPHTKSQSVYERQPHHRPDSLVWYWPYTSKAHADRDFKRNWIHVYGGN